MKKLVFTNDERDMRTDKQLMEDLERFVLDSDSIYFYTANGSVASYLFRLLAISQNKYPVTSFSIIGHNNKEYKLDVRGEVSCTTKERDMDFSLGMIPTAQRSLNKG